MHTLASSDLGNAYVLTISASMRDGRTVPDRDAALKAVFTSLDAPLQGYTPLLSSDPLPPGEEARNTRHVCACEYGYCARVCHMQRGASVAVPLTVR